MMKNIYTALSIILSTATCIIVFISFQSKKNAGTKEVIQPSQNYDSGKLSSENDYLKKILGENQKAANLTLDIKSMEAYVIKEDSKEPIKMALQLKENGKFLIIRYSEIGCNACADSVFSILREDKTIAQKFTVMVWVDFTEYEYYLKWKKLSEVEYPIVCIKKGTINIPAEKLNNSYIFTVSPNYVVNSLFIPDFKYTTYLRDYFKNITL